MAVKKFIPNAITSMNLVCGALGVIFALSGRMQTAFLLMMAAAVFDFCDGLAARLLDAYSDIGKELDSLCDAVSFGLLPALMLYASMNPAWGAWRLMTLVLAVCSAFRLAKFNLDERQSDSFLGLPTPAAAMVCGALACYLEARPDGHLGALSATVWALPLVAVLLSALLVSEIPMFSFKLGKGAAADTVTRIKRISFLTVTVLSALSVALLRAHWSLIPLASFLAYILLNVAFLPLKARP